MNNRTIIELANYFEGIKKSRNLTEQETNFLWILNSRKEFFDITSVSRDDLESVGFDTNSITDEQMIRLSDKMADDYCEQLFWESMETIADILEFPRKEEFECKDNDDDE